MRSNKVNVKQNEVIRGAMRGRKLQRMRHQIHPYLTSSSSRLHIFSCEVIEKLRYTFDSWIGFNMPRPANREEVLARLRKTVADGSIIVGAGAGKIAIQLRL